MAGECPSTCCAGWNIRIDAEAMERFRSLSDGDQREDILQHIKKKRDGYYFMNRPDGSCEMLDPDGLCRIQRRSREEMLCITCRKFPRLAGKTGEDYRMSMAASCPVVAEYLWKGKIGWYVTAEGKSYPLKESEIPIPEENRRLLDQSLYQKYQLVKKEEPSVRNQILCLWNIYQKMYEITDGCIELLAASPELSYLEGSFDYFEKSRENTEILEDIIEFKKQCGGHLQKFAGGYIRYRIYSRYLEFPKESSTQNLYHVLGELFVVFILRFSRNRITKRNDIETAVAEINWMYRLCAHAECREQKFEELLRNIFINIDDLSEIIIRSFSDN